MSADDVHVHRRIQRAESDDGLRVSAYRGDGAVLLAFDLHADQTRKLAGFAVHCTPRRERRLPIDRLNLGSGLVSDDGPEARVWTPSVPRRVEDGAQHAAAQAAGRDASRREGVVARLPRPGQPPLPGTQAAAGDASTRV